MDSDHSSSSSSPAAAKLRYCSCRKRMSTLTFDFHSSCISCHGIHCDFDNRCEECANIDDNTMTVYVRRRRSLLAKQRSKSKRKDPLLLAAAIDSPLIVGDSPSSVEVPPLSLNFPSVTDEIHSTVDAKFSVFKDEIQQHFRLFFVQFNEQFSWRLNLVLLDSLLVRLALPPFYHELLKEKSNPRLKRNRKGIIVKDKEFYIPMLNTFPTR